jgi:hypothetical protein
VAAADPTDLETSYTLDQIRAFRGGLEVRRCASCGVAMPASKQGLTCSPECSRYREKMRNRQRAEAWRNNAKQAMAGVLGVFGESDPPPMMFLHLLAAVPHGSRLTLDLPDGSMITWSRP